MAERVPTSYLVTRRQKRAAAKKNMEVAEKKGFNKHSYITMQRNGFKFSNRVGSYFSENWRDFVEVDDGGKRN